jgi:hypothetical protein
VSNGGVAPVAGPVHLCRSRWLSTLLGAALGSLLVVVPVLGGSVALAPRAGADQVSDLQAEAAQISQDMLHEQLELGGFQAQYTAETQKVQQDAVLLAQAQGRLAGVRHRIQGDRQALTHEAVLAYVTGADTDGGVSSLFTSNQRTTDSQNEYSQAGVGDVTVTLAQLHSDQEAFQAQEGAIRQLQSQDESAQSQAASVVQQAENTQNQLQQQSAQVNGQLAVAVAQQQAAEAAAAAAAVKAAQEKAEQEAAAQQAAQQQAAEQAAQQQAAQQQDTQQQTETQAPPTTAQEQSPPTTAQEEAPMPAVTPTTPALSPAPDESSSSDVTDPALNPFLTCVVQAESSGNYGAVSPDGQYMGAFQFSQSTWNEAAQLAGDPSLVGVAPNTASQADQDTLAVALYGADGEQPWYDPCNTTGN